MKDTHVIAKYKTFFYFNVVVISANTINVLTIHYIKLPNASDNIKQISYMGNKFYQTMVSEARQIKLSTKDITKQVF